MAHRVILNFADVTAFQNKIAKNHVDRNVAIWLNSKLRDYIMSEYKNVKLLTRSEVIEHFEGINLPVVISKALINNELIYKVELTEQFERKISDLQDYLSHLIKENKDIQGMQFEVAISGSDKWHQSFGKVKKKVKNDFLDGIRVLKQFDSGYFLGKLLTQKQYDYEGQLMGHCVDGYFGGETSIMSYRDPSNKPLITIEYKRSPNGKDIEILQARGYANKAVIDGERIVEILDYLYSTYRNVNIEDSYVFGSEYNGRPLLCLPEGSVIDGDIDFEYCIGLPKNLVVNGDLELSYATINVLKNLTVNGSLKLENCEIFAIDESVNVSGHIKLDNSLVHVVSKKHIHKIV